MGRSIGWVCVLVVVAGCGGGTSGTADAGGIDTGVPPVDTGVPPIDTGVPPVDTGVPPTDTGTPIDAAAVCSFIDSVDRSCTSDTDCVVRLHQTDCCGNSVMVGVNQSAAAQFAVDESACMASYPGCGCPAMLPTTDSGETVTDTSMVQAGCISRGPGSVCLTYVTMRPPPGR
jgi:hypothetical protein